MSSSPPTRDHDALLAALDDKCRVLPAMRSALLDIYSNTLTCSLCEGLFRTPHVICCGHTFCQECIVDYSDNNYTCPVKNCGMSMTMGNGQHFSSLNPALETSVDSWVNIIKTLERAPVGWWRHAGDIDGDQPDETGNEDGSLDEEGSLDDINHGNNSNTHNVAMAMDFENAQQSLQKIQSTTRDDDEDETTFATAESNLSDDDDASSL